MYAGNGRTVVGIWKPSELASEGAWSLLKLAVRHGRGDGMAAVSECVCLCIAKENVRKSEYVRKDCSSAGDVAARPLRLSHCDPAAECATAKGKRATSGGVVSGGDGGGGSQEACKRPTSDFSLREEEKGRQWHMVVRNLSRQEGG